jgi:hypothetical protein
MGKVTAGFSMSLDGFVAESPTTLKGEARMSTEEV